MTRARRSDATPLATIAEALAEADRSPDAEVAERYGVSRATIKEWRAMAPSTPKLAALLVAARERAIEAWRPEAAMTFVAIARKIRSLLERNEPIPFELIAAAKTFGAANIEAGALLGDGRRAHQDPATNEGDGEEAHH